ncbi:hypothetical protein RJ639_023450 [Escallonia herrerae]|uniref:Uncharacterized protein n=1 Tax=Escallonia herrerae TaxID=1293975 RepID=A0AA89ACF8_9ASTE|nr:hypothetical protein RJ639_023450 [Escallonia herrerae]
MPFLVQIPTVFLFILCFSLPKNHFPLVPTTWLPCYDITTTDASLLVVGALWGYGHDVGQVLFSLLFLILKNRLHIEVGQNRLHIEVIPT